MLKSRGAMIDELIKNRRYLSVVHALLGVASIFAFLARQGMYGTSRAQSFQLAAAWRVKGEAIDVVLHSVFAWSPYLISWALSQKILVTRDTKIVLSFLSFVVVCFFVSIFVDLPAVGPFSVVVFVYWILQTFALTITCLIVALITPNMTARPKH